MNKWIKEVVLVCFIAIPYIYLATIWDQLPERVPIHFNLKGEADGWGDKSTYLFLPGLVTGITYILLLLIPAIDPKRRVDEMGSKYYSFRLILGAFTSLIAMYMVKTSQSDSMNDSYLLLAVFGLFFAAMGNYFQTIRPNYFIGIRTPWTLESEEIWKKTHLVGGRMWVAGGITITAGSLIIRNSASMMVIFAIIVLIITVIPAVYSFLLFRKQKT
jgi:uncharacterized membrane protein